MVASITIRHRFHNPTGPKPEDVIERAPQRKVFRYRWLCSKFVLATTIISLMALLFSFSRREIAPTHSENSNPASREREGLVTNSRPSEEKKGKKDSFFTGDPFHFPQGSFSPFPHYVSSKLLDDDFYKALERDFPDVPEAVSSGLNTVGIRSIVRTDRAYQELIDKSPAWKALNDFVYSQKMIDFGMKLYGESLANDTRCVVDPTKARFVDQNESMSTRDPVTGAYVDGLGLDKAPYYRRRKKRVGNPNDLYVVMDFAHGPGNMTNGSNVPYTKPRHRDWPWRVFGILVYFSDTDESSGGHFQVYAGEQVDRIVQPQRNFGVSHMSSHVDSWHGAAAFTRPDAYRRHIQIQASSPWSVCRKTWTS